MNETFAGLEEYIEVSPNFTQEFIELKSRGTATAMQVVRFFNLQGKIAPGHFLYFECCSGGAVYLCWKGKHRRFFDREERLFMVRPESLKHFELNLFPLHESDRVYYELARVIEYPTESVQVVAEKIIPGIFEGYPKKGEDGNPVFIRYPMQVDSKILRMVSAKGFECMKYLKPGQWIGVIITETGYGVLSNTIVYDSKQHCKETCEVLNLANGYDLNYSRLLIYHSMKNSI